MKARCTNCGQDIEHVVIIDGAPFGTTCAANKLGLLEMPTWFKGGDWNEAKIKNEVAAKLGAEKFEDVKKVTADFWYDYHVLCKAFYKATAQGNDWKAGFVQSIASQLNYFNLTPKAAKFDDFNDAVNGWGVNDGDFPYMNKAPKSIDSLSDKQKNILFK
jgi:hypothetical protein